MPILGKATRDTQRNIRIAQKELEDSLLRKLQKKIRNKYPDNKDPFLLLPTFQEIPENLDFPHDKNKEVFKVYEFKPTTLSYLEGLAIMFSDGTAEINISATSWEFESETLLKEIREWGFEKSPFQIKDEKGKYKSFFSKDGVSVDTGERKGYADTFCLLSAYFIWIYGEKLQKDGEDSVQFLLPKEKAIAVERSLTG